jgi:hypothetical protein
LIQMIQASLVGFQYSLSVPECEADKLKVFAFGLEAWK